MARLLTIDPTDPTRCSFIGSTTMSSHGFTETAQLEAWVVEHPEVLGDDLLVVTTQFQRWESDTESARERLDILALSASGESVVIELKRDGDRNVHLQALTYAALVSGFTRETLAQVHHDWLTKRGESDQTLDDARRRLEDHVEGEWTDEMLGLPRVILVAESFPAQVLTTVQWLANVTSTLVIEAHEYHLFEAEGGVIAAFQRLLPVDDVSDRVLRPVSAIERAGVSDQFVENKRRAKSTSIISAYGNVPEGAAVTLDLNGLVKAPVIEQVTAWMEEDPIRSEVAWTNHSSKPLRWRGGEDEPVQSWTPTALRNEVFSRAGVDAKTFSAADAWRIEGRNLYTLAEEIMSARESVLETAE